MFPNTNWKKVDEDWLLPTALGEAIIHAAVKEDAAKEPLPFP